MANGLPPLPGAILATIPTVILAGLNPAAGIAPTQTPVYGIFTQQSGSTGGQTNALGTTTNPFQAGSPGQAALTGYASIVGFSTQADSKTPTYPIEQGGFGTYNKVEMPSGFKLQYTVNGGPQQISAFVGRLQALKADTNLYTVVMPEYGWQNVNVIHWDTRRTGSVNNGRGSGISLVTFDVWLNEIRQANAPQFSNTGTGASPTATATPDAQAQQQDGTVQPTAPQNALGTSTNPFQLPGG